MYFPYLRGKQFELIVLREINEFTRDNSLISPIIEPVKETNVTLSKSLQCMVRENQNFNLIINPSAGDIKNPEKIIEVMDEVLGDYENYQPAVIIDERKSIDRISRIIDKHEFKNLSVICNGIPRSEEEFFDFLSNADIKQVILNEGISTNNNRCSK